MRIGLGLVLAVILAVGVLWYVTVVRMIEGYRRVTHTHRVLEQLDALSADLHEVEANQRAYILGRGEEYRRAFDEAVAQVDRVLDSLGPLTADNEAQQQRLAELRHLIVARRGILRRLLDAAATNGPRPGGRPEFVTPEALQLTSEAHGVIRRMDAEERSLLGQRDADAEATALFSRWAAAAGTALGVVALALAGLLIVRPTTASLQEAVGRLTSTGAELLAGVEQQAAGAQEQAAAVAETVTTVDEVTQTANQSAQRARGVQAAVQHALDIGRDGRRVVDDSTVATEKVRATVASTAERLLGLAEQARKVDDIIGAVNDIADQTNLLSLNAAIEASRAGEHGKGFAVVAGEVKQLAEQSKQATREIRQILEEIQRAMHTTVLATEDVSRGVAEASGVVGKASDTIKCLAETLEEVARAAAQIVASAGQQATGVSQINLAMKNIDQVSRQNLAATRQAEQAAQHLNALGLQLARLIGQ
jgi:methyl-accepting chemotaxis protein